MHRIQSHRSTLVNSFIGTILLLLLLLQFHSVFGHVGSDFKIFYRAAARFNEDPFSLYALDSIRTLQGYLYPPPAILVLRWLPSFDAPSAYAVFLLLLYGLIAASAILWMRMIEGEASPIVFNAGERIVGVLAALAAGPVFSAAASGQVDALILFLCSLYVLLLRRGNLFVAGLVVSLGFWIKIYPVLLLVYAFSAKGRLALIPGFLSGLVLVPLALLAWIPADIYVDYFLNYLPNLSRGTIVNIYNQSLSAFLMRLILPASDTLGSFDAVQVTSLVRFTVIGAACAFLWYIGGYLRDRRLEMIALAVVVSTSSWLAPLGWGHTYVYVLPMVLVLWGRYKGAYGEVAFYVFWAVYLAMVLPAYHQFSWLLSTSSLIGNLIYSRYLFFVLALVLLSIAFMRKARED